ncbi:unnamed protein product [Ascophyllum nodosum]
MCLSTEEVPLSSDIRDGLDTQGRFPGSVKSTKRCFVAFQELDGCNVILFVFFVNEVTDPTLPTNNGRVYLRLVDSVGHFRPRGLRSMAYQYILVGYMADAQRGGFKAVHVWSSSSFGGGNYILRGGEQGFPDRALLDCYV